MSNYPGIDADEAVRLLSTFVSTPSVNPAYQRPGEPDEWFGEAPMANALARWLEAQGIPVGLDEMTPGRPNLIARLKGRGGGKRMLWEGHSDTVQVTGMDAPFDPKVRDGRLYGRGAVDDGASVVAFMLALRALAQNPPAADVDLLIAVDEEYGFQGIARHMAKDAAYDLGVAGEPTDLRVVSACKGTVRWFVDLHGRSAHTAKPHEGVSAIDAARHLLAAYEGQMARRTAEHPLLGPATLTCTGFEAGEGANTVPSRARLRFDYRYLPSETGSGVYEDFRRIAESVPEKMPGVTVTVEPPFVDSAAMDVTADSLVVRRMGAVCAARGIPAEPLGVPYGSDATKMVGMGGIPTIVFGPGSIDQAHAIDEFVEIAQVVEAARMLVDLARDPELG